LASGIANVGEMEYHTERARLLSRLAELQPLQPTQQLEMERAAELLANTSEIWSQTADAECEQIVHAVFQKLIVNDKMIVVVEAKGEFHSLLAVACGMDSWIKLLETRA
jgi:hypothetical protein